MSQIALRMGKRPAYRTLQGGWKEIDLPPDIQDQKEVFLNAVNQLLAEKRLLAHDHERDDNEKFYGAALLKTCAGQYFLNANVHLQNSKTTRNCAEANSGTEAWNEEGPDMEIEHVYFMGAKGDLSKGLEVLTRDWGKRFTPCGSCLDVIWNSRLRGIKARVGEETKVTLLPANDGTMHVRPDDGRPIGDLNPHQAMTRTIGDLLPHVTVSLADAQGAIKETLRTGWELLNDRSTRLALSAAMKADALIQLNGMADRPASEIERAINATMIDTVRDLGEKSAFPLKNARVAVVRLDNGEYYMGVSLDNGRTSAMQGAEADAIESALSVHPTGHCVTDIFVMDVDFKKMPQLLKHWDTSPSDDITVSMPDGAARDRISKNGPPPKGLNVDRPVVSLFGNVVNSETGPNIHSLLVNDKAHYEPAMHRVTMSLKDLMPLRFISPKMSASSLSIN